MKIIEITGDELCDILTNSEIVKATDHAGLRLTWLIHPTDGKVVTIQGPYDGGILITEII